MSRKSKLIIHTCCAPCSAFLVEKLSNDYQVTVLYNNDNIYPKQEYFKRLTELKKYFLTKKVPVMIMEYDHDQWLRAVQGWEGEPEKGQRCLVCYEYRLRQTAQFAKQHGFDCFASTLAISPHKLAQHINRLGQTIASEYQVKFLAEDWKKQDGFKQAMIVAKKQGFYRQHYCGCEFSFKHLQNRS